MPQATTSANLHKTHFSPGNVILHVLHSPDSNSGDGIKFETIA